MCKCRVGYHGTNCELTIEMPSSITFPMPTCPECTTVVPDSWTSCSCPEMPTATPERCSTELSDQDYCLGDPCMNNGTCYSIAGDYMCVCESKRTGKNCTEGIHILICLSL